MYKDSADHLHVAIVLLINLPKASCWFTPGPMNYITRICTKWHGEVKGGVVGVYDDTLFIRKDTDFPLQDK